MGKTIQKVLNKNSYSTHTLSFHIMTGLKRPWRFGSVIGTRWQSATFTSLINDFCFWSTIATFVISRKALGPLNLIVTIIDPNWIVEYIFADSSRNGTTSVLIKIDSFKKYCSGLIGWFSLKQTKPNQINN